MNATGVTAGPAESNGRLLLSKWRDSLHVSCGLTACTPGSAPGPTLGNEYGKTLPFLPARVSSYATGCRLSPAYVASLILSCGIVYESSFWASMHVYETSHDRCGASTVDRIAAAMASVPPSLRRRSVSLIGQQLLVLFGTGRGGVAEISREFRPDDCIGSVTTRDLLHTGFYTMRP